MTCETIKIHLVAYRDGELPELERAHVAAHLSTCSACTHEEAQLARVGQLLMSLERVTPSPDFAATFWRRLEAEGQREPEARLAYWWSNVREWFTGWQLAPALAAAATLLVFLSSLQSGRFTVVPTSPTQTPAPQVAEDIPAPLAEKPELFVNYRIITDLDRLSHFEEIATVQIPGEQEVEIASEDILPPELLKDPSFFVHYPLLQRMEQLENLEAVLSVPTEGNEQSRG